MTQEPENPDAPDLSAAHGGSPRDGKREDDARTNDSSSDQDAVKDTGDSSYDPDITATIPVVRPKGAKGSKKKASKAARGTSKGSVAKGGSNAEGRAKGASKSEGAVKVVSKSEGAAKVASKSGDAAKGMSSEDLARGTSKLENAVKGVSQSGGAAEAASKARDAAKGAPQSSGEAGAKVGDNVGAKVADNVADALKSTAGVGKARGDDAAATDRETGAADVAAAKRVTAGADASTSDRVAPGADAATDVGVATAADKAGIGAGASGKAGRAGTSGKSGQTSAPREANVADQAGVSGRSGKVDQAARGISSETGTSGMAKRDDAVEVAGAGAAGVARIAGKAGNTPEADARSEATRAKSEETGKARAAEEVAKPEKAKETTSKDASSLSTPSPAISSSSASIPSSSASSVPGSPTGREPAGPNAPSMPEAAEPKPAPSTRPEFGASKQRPKATDTGLAATGQVRGEASGASGDAKAGEISVGAPHSSADASLTDGLAARVGRDAAEPSATAAPRSDEHRHTRDVRAREEKRREERRREENRSDERPHQRNAHEESRRQYGKDVHTDRREHADQAISGDATSLPGSLDSGDDTATIPAVKRFPSSVGPIGSAGVSVGSVKGSVPEEDRTEKPQGGGDASADAVEKNSRTAHTGALGDAKGTFNDAKILPDSPIASNLNDIPAPEAPSEFSDSAISRDAGAAQGSTTTSDLSVDLGSAAVSRATVSGTREAPDANASATGTLSSTGSASDTEVASDATAASDTFADIPARSDIDVPLAPPRMDASSDTRAFDASSDRAALDAIASSMPDSAGSPADSTAEAPSSDAREEDEAGSFSRSAAWAGLVEPVAPGSGEAEAESATPAGTSEVADPSHPRETTPERSSEEGSHNRPEKVQTEFAEEERAQFPEKARAKSLEKVKSLEKARAKRPEKARQKRSALIWVAAAALIFGIVYVGIAFYFSDKIPSNTTVAGVKVGGMSREDAAAKLKSQLSSRLSGPVKVSIGGKEQTFEPSSVDAKFNERATVDSLAGFSLNPVRIWDNMTGGSDVAPTVDVNESKMKATVDSMVKESVTEPIDASIKFVGIKPKVTKAHKGVSLNRDESVKKITETMLDGKTIVLPVEEKEPEIKDSQAQEALTKLAKPLVSGNLTVKVDSTPVSVTPKQLASVATFVKKDGELKIKLDAEKLGDIVRKAAPSKLKEGKDAKIEIVNHTTPKISPSEDGVGVDEAKLAESAAEAATTGDRTVEVTTKSVPAKFTTEDAQKMGVKEVVSSIETPLTNDAIRTTNLKVGTEKVANTLVKPGEEFSLLKTLGPIDKAHGFVPSGVVDNGFNSTAFGGGLSQLSTNTFNLGYRAGFVDVEHKPHSKYFSRYPMGMESTLWQGKYDMRFKNNTPYGAVIDTWIADGKVYSKLWSTKYWDVDVSTSKPYSHVSPTTKVNPARNCEPSPAGDPGFTVTVSRKVSRGGKVHDNSSYKWTYSPTHKVVCSK